MLLTESYNLWLMKTEEAITHITDDMGNDVVTPFQLDKEYDALCAVAEAADHDHRANCRLLTMNCPICQALADLDVVRLDQSKFHHN